MKKMILGLVMVVMMLGCVGCGKEEAKNAKEIKEIASENEGFVPEQVTEEPVITEEVAQDIEEVIDENNLEKYYDVTEYLGTPTLAYCLAQRNQVENIITVSRTTENGGYYEYTIEYNDKIKSRGYNMIFVDNNTPDDYSDDLIAYIFVNSKN